VPPVFVPLADVGIDELVLSEDFVVPIADAGCILQLLDRPMGASSQKLYSAPAEFRVQRLQRMADLVRQLPATFSVVAVVVADPLFTRIAPRSVRIRFIAPVAGKAHRAVAQAAVEGLGLTADWARVELRMAQRSGARCDCGTMSR